MSRPLGIVAGSGEFPFYICREAEKHGYSPVAAAVRDQASPDLEKVCAVCARFEPRRMLEIEKFFKRHGVREAVFAGKIDPRAAFDIEGAGGLLPRLLGLGSDTTATAIIEKAIRWLTQKGIEVIDPRPFLRGVFCEEGILSRSHGGGRILNDIDFGWDKARLLADHEVGQTLVVKNGSVAAVEGLEGTDAAIRRGGELAGPGIVVVKRSRTRQDPRIDLPAVGLETVKSLAEVRGAALCFEAETMPFFRREEAVALADEHGIVLRARS